MHNSLPIVPILSQMNSVQAIPSYCFNSYFNIFLPSMPSSFKCCLSFRFPHQFPYAFRFASLTDRKSNHEALHYALSSSSCYSYFRSLGTSNFQPYINKMRICNSIHNKLLGFLYDFRNILIFSRSVFCPQPNFHTRKPFMRMQLYE